MDLNPDNTNVDELSEMAAGDLLRWAFETAGDRAAIGTSLQRSGVVMIDLAAGLPRPFRVFFIDTELDYDETYELLGRVEQRYGITVERFGPDHDEALELRKRLGRWEHYFDRRACCFVRKVRPLQRAHQTLDVWISGLRADQSEHRQATARKAAWITAASGRKLLKLNPLLDWTQETIDRHIADNDVPYNALYDQVSEFGERFGVISCRRCHIPVMPHLDGRAGKWPWECGMKKECGLHERGGGI